MTQTNLDNYLDIRQEDIPREIILNSKLKKWQMKVEMLNCNGAYLSTVKKVICIHPANHSVALFLKMKDKADICLYCHPLLAKEESKQFVISYTQKYNYPLVILTRMETIEVLMRNNGVPHKHRRWCSRVFKIEPTILFYKTYIPSGVIEYFGIQKFQSKERSKMTPELKKDPKSQKRYKIYSELPIFYESEEFSTKMMQKAQIHAFKDSVRGYNRYGCFLCPFAGKKYYEELKENDIKTYNECCRLMSIASEKQPERYYYYRKSKVM